MDHKLSYLIFFLLTWIFPFTLSSCNGMVVTPSPSGQETLLTMSAEMSAPCEECTQATLAAIQIQEKNRAENKSAATAEIERANAQATLSAAQNQGENNANIIEAQIAATAEIERANAQATLNSAESTMNAAIAQEQNDLRELQAAGTRSVEAFLIQQKKNELAATQSAIATQQWYTDQRQREEQRQAPIKFLWTFCMPIFAVLFAGLCLWGFWSWLKTQQRHQRFTNQQIENRQTPEDLVRLQDGSLPPEREIVDGRYRLTQPNDQMRHWMDEIKRELINHEKDKDDDADG